MRPKRRDTKKSPHRWATRGTPGTMDGRRLNGSRLVRSATSRTVHVWTNRPLAYWPQGIPRPRAAENRHASCVGTCPASWRALANAMGLYSVPDTLSWDLFLGPAPHVEYHPRLSPVQLARVARLGRRRHRRHGCALHRPRLSGPSILVIRPLSKRSRRRSIRVCFPMATTTYYEFPARGYRPAVKLTWYDGGLLPPRPRGAR